MIAELRTFLHSLFLFLLLSAQAQTQLFTNEDGLSSKDISCVLQARNGYLWVGTSNGLNLYDGFSFYEFNRHNGLSNGKITCLHEDKKGLLWIGTWEGLNILNQQTGEIRQYFQKQDAGRTVHSTEITAITEAPDGSVLVGMGTGTLIQFTGENSFKTVYAFPNPGDIRYKIISICILPDSGIYLLDNFDLVRRLTHKFTEDTGFKKETTNTVGMYVFKAPQLQLLTVDIWNCCSWLSPSGELIRQLPSPKPLVRTEHLTAQYRTGNGLWSVYNQGSLWYTDLVTLRSVEYTSELNHAVRWLPKCIYCDKNGLIWLGSNNGLLKFCPKKRYFENYMLSQNDDYRMRNSIRGMVEDKNGDIYIGGYNGLFRMTKQNEEPERLLFRDATDAVHKKAYYPYRLLNDDHCIWIASETRGFYRYNKRTGLLEFPLGDHVLLKGFALLPEGTDSIWLGTSSGLFIYSKRKNTLTKYSHPSDRFDIGNIEITELAADAVGNLWIGTYASGLFKMQKNKGIVQRISDSETSYPVNFITTLFFADDSILWTGTRGGGLGRLNISTGHMRFYTKADGLADNSVAGIVKDSKGLLWISTFNGLSKFDSRQGTFTNYYEKDGLTENEFNTAAYLKSSTGKIFMGGLNGVNAFYPDSLVKGSVHRPVIVLTRFAKYNGSTGKLEERMFGGPGPQALSFTHRDKFLSFSFSLDDYYKPLRNTFFYKLEGYDNDWNNLGTQHTLRFNSLPAGKYQLRIRGVNSEGTASVNELLIPVVVSPAYYSTWWFYLLIFAATVALVYSVTRYRIYQGLKIRKLRTKISSDLHDEVGSLLTRISVQAELIKQGISQNDTMQEVARIADTSRMATAAMSDVLWSIDARNDKMGDLVDRLREQAGEILFPLEMEVNFEVRQLDLSKEIDNSIRQNLFLVFKEAVHNIAKHSGATQVNIVLENRGNQFIMSIEDNGSAKKGAAAGRQGQGLRNMKMRAELIEGVLEISDSKGYTIVLKLKKFA